MKRELMTVLIGVSLLAANDAEAQRARGGDRSDRRERAGVERLEPVRAPGRVVARRAARVERVVRHAPAPRGRVVYSSRGRRAGYDRRVVWVRPTWERSVRFHAVARYRGFLKQGELNALIGHRTVRIIRDAGRDAGLRGALRGHWISEPGLGRVLVVTMGGGDVAELLDYDRDGLVDEVYLIGPRGFRPMANPW